MQIDSSPGSVMSMRNQISAVTARDSEQNGPGPCTKGSLTTNTAYHTGHVRLAIIVMCVSMQWSFKNKIQVSMFHFLSV